MVREIVAAFVAWAIAGAALAQDAQAPVVGPLRLGMSLAEVRAAIPTATWEDTAFTQHTRTPVAIRADDAITIAGTPFDVSAHVLYDERRLSISAVIPATTVAACDAKARDLYAALEPGLPSPGASAPEVIPGARTTMPWNVQRLPGGAMVVTPGVSTQGSATTFGETIQIGAATPALIDARDDKGRPVATRDFAKRPPTRYRLEARTRYDHVPYVVYSAEFGQFLDPTACNITLSATIPDARHMEERAFEPAKLGAPLISYRHWRAATLGAIPAQGIEVPLDCSVDRATNRVRVCMPDGPTPPGLERYASTIERIYETTTYDLGAVDKDDPLPVRVRFQGRIDPGDRRPIDFLDQPRTSIKDLRFRRVTTATQWQDLYSTGLRAKGLQAIVTMTCQIQTDYSVVCGNIRAEDQDATVAAAFEPAVLAGMTWAYAAETAKDGASSVGRVFDYKLGFKLEP